MHAPPPPVFKKKSNTGVIIGVVIAAVVVIGGLCAFGGMRAFQLAKTAPVARQGFGKPTVVRKVNEDWSVYKFPEAELQLELPAKPVAGTIDWDKGDGLFIKEWIYYDIDSLNASLSLAGFWYRSAEFVDLKEEINSIREEMEKHPDFKNFKGTDNSQTYGSNQGRELVASYTVANQPGKLKVFVWSKGRAVYMVQTVYSGELEADASQEFERIASSAQHL